MALNKNQLQASLTAGFIPILSNPQTANNVVQISQQLATVIAENIDIYVKQGNAVGADTGGDAHNLTIT